mmetsp:Transcript_30642/g.86675  ORF Transcript_30642/g.86675 Transcript_30642/m.86675 type:complete len:412 (+) Transcript_30642:3-1238(+)
MELQEAQGRAAEAEQRLAAMEGEWSQRSASSGAELGELRQQAEEAEGRYQQAAADAAEALLVAQAREGALSEELQALKAATQAHSQVESEVARLKQALTERSKQLASADSAVEAATQRAVQAEAAAASYAETARQSSESATQWAAAAEEARLRAAAAEAAAADAQQALNRAAAAASVASEAAKGDASERNEQLSAALKAAQHREAVAEQRAASLAQKVAELENAAQLITGMGGSGMLQQRAPGGDNGTASRLREMAKRLSDQDIEMMNLRARNQAMAMELATERKRVADAEAMAASVTSAARSAVGIVSQVSGSSPGGDVRVSISNKRDDDAAGGDVEAALLSGGGDSTFVPLAGLLRSGGRAQKCCNTPAPLAAAKAMDRVTVALHRRPAARLAFAVYLLMVHGGLLMSI